MSKLFRKSPPIRIYGTMFEDSTGTQINMATGGTYYGWVSATSGLSNAVTFTGDATADRLVVHDPGNYFVMGTFAFSGSVAINVIGKLFKNSTGVGSIDFERKLSASGDIGSASFSGALTMNAEDFIDVRFTADGDTKNIVLKHCNLFIFKL
jgi:hypothetical protein